MWQRISPAAGLLAILCSNAAADITGRYYLLFEGGRGVYVVQGRSIVARWFAAGGITPMAVCDTVRTYGAHSGTIGIEYTLEGVATGARYPWMVSTTHQLTDGATDGGTFNFVGEYPFGLSYPPYHLQMFTGDWQQATPLFASNEPITGVTYDQLWRTLWISVGFADVRRVTPSGIVLSSFQLGTAEWSALAWEVETDTLWVCSHLAIPAASTTRVFRQYNKTGTMLQTLAIDGFPGGSSPVRLFSGEFRVPAVPPLPCYANCDGSATPPVLNVDDFVCFQSRFAAGEPYADCTHDSMLNVNDFICFQQAFAAGCP